MLRAKVTRSSFFGLADPQRRPCDGARYVPPEDPEGFQAGHWEIVFDNLEAFLDFVQIHNCVVLRAPAPGTELWYLEIYDAYRE